MFKHSSRLIGTALVAAALGMVSQVQATVLIFEYSLSFGAVPSDGTSPWLTATFDDFGGTGTVQLTMSASGLSTDLGGGGQTPEYADEWWFNLNPLKDPVALSFSYVSGVAATSIIDPSNASGGDLKPDGDGTYDFLFNFAATHLEFGETSVYNLSLAGLTALDFNFLSQPPTGGEGPFLAAAHIQSTGVNNLGSDFVGPTANIPEPATLALAGLGFAGLGFSRRRKIR